MRRDSRPPERRLRTYSHLEGLGRAPTAYEIATTGLLHHPARGLEVDLPFGAWIDRHVHASPLRSSAWERFADPRAMTYAQYVARRHDAEVGCDALLATIADTGYDAALSPSWRGTLEALLVPARFPLHALQMAAAYVGQLAPASRITIVCALSAADELPAVQRLCRRTAQIAEKHPGFGDGARARFLGDPAWQPLRELVERLLVTYDLGEALVALFVVVKPAIDELFLSRLPVHAQAHGDPLLRPYLHSLLADARWQREWTLSLVRALAAESPANRDAIAGWVAGWAVRTRAALGPLFAGLDPDGAEALAAQAACVLSTELDLGGSA